MWTWKQESDFQMALTHFDFSFQMKVVKANKLCYWFFLFFLSLLSVPGKLQSTEKELQYYIQSI